MFEFVKKIAALNFLKTEKEKLDEKFGQWTPLKAQAVGLDQKMLRNIVTIENACVAAIKVRKFRKSFVFFDRA